MPRDDGQGAPARREPHVLSIDLGTSGPKVALVSLSGRVAAAAAGFVRTIVVPPKGAEQDPEEIWRAVAQAVRAVMGAAGVPRDDVAALTLASQYSSLVALDDGLRPIGNLVLWMDERGAAQTQALWAREPRVLPRWLDVHGLPPLPAGNDSLSHWLWLRAERPQWMARARCVVEPADYLAARLSGRATANACTAFMQVLTDNRDLERVRWSDDLIALAGVERALLPELVAPFSPIGPLRADVADELGLSPRTLVLSGCNDTQAVSVATAPPHGAAGGANVGTTSQILAHVAAKQTDLATGIATSPSPLPGHYAVLAENGIGARALDWWLRSVLARGIAAEADRAMPAEALDATQPGVAPADSAGTTACSSRDPFAALEALAAASPPGANGVLFLPWLTGAHAPASDPSMRGAFLNLGLGTTPADLVRAVMEGVALSLAWLVPAVESFAGRSFSALRFAGGAARSSAWSQILADATGRPVHQLDDARHVINRATALLGFHALGLAELDRLDAFCPVRRILEPAVAHRALYEDRLARLVQAFEALRPVLAALRGSRDAQ